MGRGNTPISVRQYRERCIQDVAHNVVWAGKVDTGPHFGTGPNPQVPQKISIWTTPPTARRFVAWKSTKLKKV